MVGRSKRSFCLLRCGSGESIQLFFSYAETDLTPVIALPGETGGKAYGGYAGLSLRLAKSTRGGTFSNCAGAAGETALHGQPAGWVKYSAGPGLPAVTIFDDPKNLGYPVKWYVNQGMPYFSPSPLFAKPLTLAAGEKLVLSYQIRIADHDGCLLTPCPTP